MDHEMRTRLLASVPPGMSSAIRNASEAEYALARLHSDEERDAAIKLARVTIYTIQESAQYIAENGIDGFVRSLLDG